MLLARALGLTAYLVGMAGVGIFYLYLVGTGSGFLPPRDTLPGPLPWLIDIGVLLLFALQHSGMARRPFKTFIKRWIPAELERSVYVATSGTAAALLVFFWQPLPGKPIWQGPLWITVVCQFAAVLIIVYSSRFDHFSFFGVTQAWMGNADIASPLCIEGPYRVVRHPLMLGLLIALWGQSVMPRELLMLNIGMTVYVLSAIHLEERDLVRQYGTAYEEYRKQVPALLPIRIRR
jgi:protein-S-isoprenylcysteine O-methyltransferase Ste14